MPRTARVTSSTGIYHIVIRGINRQIIFEEANDFRKYLRIIENVKIDCNFQLMAYALMSNHVHLIIHVNDVPLEIIFKKINTCYAQWFNKKYQRCGHLQQERFYSEPIESEKYLLNAIRYVHQNPLKAGLENETGAKYKWTSFSAYLKNNSSLVDINFITPYIDIEDFLILHKTISPDSFFDIDSLQKRINDNIAKEIIFKITNCSNGAEFQQLPIIKRNEYLHILHDNNLSIRQLNRLTGISKGSIERILKT